MGGEAELPWLAPQIIKGYLLIGYVYGRHVNDALMWTNA